MRLTPRSARSLGHEISRSPGTRTKRWSPSPRRTTIVFTIADGSTPRAAAASASEPTRPCRVTSCAMPDAARARSAGLSSSTRRAYDDARDAWDDDRAGPRGTGPIGWRVKSFARSVWSAPRRAATASASGFAFYSDNPRRRRPSAIITGLSPTPPVPTTVTRLTVYGSLMLLAGGIGAFLLLEWSNAGTLGGLSPWGKVVGGVTGGVVPRTAGFNSIDYANVTPETMAVNYVLMFIGGGSGGTAGGIKVTTFFLLAFVIWSEVRGERDTNIAHRSIGGSTLRQALTVVLLALAAIAVGTMMILLVTDYSLDVVLFETISAFATVGLSTGITPQSVTPSARSRWSRAHVLTRATSGLARSRPRYAGQADVLVPSTHASPRRSATLHAARLRGLTPPAWCRRIGQLLPVCRCRTDSQFDPTRARMRRSCPFRETKIGPVHEGPARSVGGGGGI